LGHVAAHFHAAAEINLLAALFEHLLVVGVMVRAGQNKLLLKRAFEERLAVENALKRVGRCELYVGDVNGPNFLLVGNLGFEGVVVVQIKEILVEIPGAGNGAETNAERCARLKIGVRQPGVEVR